MALRLHLSHSSSARTAPSDERPGLGARVFAVQRTGAILVGLFLLLFGLLGFASGQRFFSTQGQPVLGMTSNGLLSTISVIVALVLLVSAARSPRTASTVMIVLGTLFLLSGVVNLFVLETRFNLLAFEFSNVVFSVAVGLSMLMLGAYGRISGHLPPDSPYAHPSTDVEFVDEHPRTEEEVAAEHAMREAEVAVTQHFATPEQYRRVQAMAHVHSRLDRRRVWMEFDRAEQERSRQDGSSPVHGGASPGRRGSRRLPWHAARTGRS